MKKIKGFDVHYVYENGNALITKRNHIFLYKLLEDKISKLLTLQYSNFLKNFINNNLLTRLLRSEIYHVFPVNDAALVVFFDHRIFKIVNNEIVNEFYIPSCKRPINVLYQKDTRKIIWGDYITSNSENKINIYQSLNNGDDWEIIYTFPKGRVRHIHNVIYDQYRGHYWVLTGDADHESGIWRTSDFKTLEPVLIGSQSFRAVSIIPMQNGLIIPSDTEFQKNYIRYFDFETMELADIQLVTNSCMFANEINGKFFISTMYEAGANEDHKYVDLWVSENKSDWKKTLSFKKDIFPLYFQYPLIKIPQYSEDYTRDTIYFSTRGTKGGSNTLILSHNDF